MKGAAIIEPTRRPERRIVSVVLLLVVTSCRAPDTPVPWNQSDIVRDLTAELRRYERLNGDFVQMEVLAWRRQVSEPKPVEFPPSAPVAAPVQRSRSDSVLLWARIGTAADSTWMLIQAYRAPDQENRWSRALINRERSNLSSPLWPGETPDGSWPGIQKFSRAPTSEEVCEFARVAFLRARWTRELRTVDGRIRENTWRRVTGSAPACQLDW